MVAAVGADELEQAGVAFETAVHDPARLAPHERRPPVARLTGQRERRAVYRPDAQPWVTIGRTRSGGGGYADNRAGTGHGILVAHSTHPRQE
jgi:hypothetical protein